MRRLVAHAQHFAQLRSSNAPAVSGWTSTAAACSHAGGPVLCVGLLAELPADLRPARAAVAYAGLNPRLLYVPALAGLQHNPILVAQSARLAALGKPGKVRVAAVMRKLLCLCIGVLCSGQPWNPAGRSIPKNTPTRIVP